MKILALVLVAFDTSQVAENTSSNHALVLVTFDTSQVASNLKL
jgi:hypothetical protein